MAVAADDDEVTGTVRKSLLSGGRSCGTAGSALTRSTGSSLLCLRKASAAPTPAGPLPTRMRPASVIGAEYPERNRCNRLRLG